MKHKENERLNSSCEVQPHQHGKSIILLTSNLVVISKLNSVCVHS